MSYLSNNPLWSLVIGTCIVGLIAWVVRSPFWRWYKRQWLKVWAVLVTQPASIWFKTQITEVVKAEIAPVIAEQAQVREDLASTDRKIDQHNAVLEQHMAEETDSREAIVKKMNEGHQQLSDKIDDALQQLLPPSPEPAS